MYREIGSEFEATQEYLLPESSGMDWLPQGDSRLLTLSGRTGIECVLRDLPHAKKALLPAYLCDSMIEPFRRAGIEVDFYGVEWDEGISTAVNIGDDVDVVLWCSYFGFDQPYPKAALRAFRDRGGVVVEDMTHSLLSRNNWHDESDYAVASLRKWFPISLGGVAIKRVGTFSVGALQMPDEQFLRIRGQAMEMKKQYIDNGNQGDKPAFLHKYGEANAMIAKLYSGAGMDENTRAQLCKTDVRAIAARRYENARILWEGLRDHPVVRPLFALREGDCPLFFPVAVPPAQRNEIRKKLTEAGIYCPVHWPHPDAPCASGLYDTELSLIVDQRYGEEDMRRMLSVINA